MPAPGQAVADLFLVVEEERRVSHSVENALGAIELPDGASRRTRQCPSYDSTAVRGAATRLHKAGAVLLVQPPGGAVAAAELTQQLTAQVGEAHRVIVVPDPGGVDHGGVWTPSYSGIDELLWLASGACGIVAQQELGWPETCSRLFDLLPRLADGEAIVLGREVVEGLDRLQTEMSDTWAVMSDPKMCWRTAFALSELAPIPPGVVDKWTEFAGYLLKNLDWFCYSPHDIRKCLSNLGRAWNHAYRGIRYQMAVEACRRGFPARVPEPRLETVDRLYALAADLDVSRRRGFSSRGVNLDELPVRLG